MWHAVYLFNRDDTVSILKCGGDPSLADHDGVTPFEVALREGDGIAAILLRIYMSINSASEVLPDKPKLDYLLLRHSENIQDADLLKMLLDLGANVNIANSDGETPLLQATHHGDLKAIEILLGRPDIDVQAKDRHGSTALHVAARNNKVQAVDLLLQDRRIDINGLDRLGNTAFWWSSFLGHDRVSRRFLDEQKLDVNFPGSRYRNGLRTTAFYLAVYRNNLPLVSHMLAATRQPRLDPNILGDDRWSPLGTAAHQGSYEMVKLLLGAKGIRINAVDESEDDHLWLAIQRCPRSVVELFLSERARLDTNCQNNKSGDTYLLAAARRGDLHLVDIILGFEGVDLNARNQQGESALEVSYRHKHDQVFQRLTGLGAVY